MVTYPALDIDVHTLVLGQHLGDSMDLVTLQAAHHTLVQPTAGDQANSEVGTCLHFQSLVGRVAVQAAAAKTSFPSAEKMKDQVGRPAAMAAAAMGSPPTGWSVLVAVGVQLCPGHHGWWLFRHPL